MSLFFFALVPLFGVGVAQDWGSICQNGQYVPNGAPDVAALAPNYPPIGQIADILPGDAVAQALFANITGDALSWTPNAVGDGGTPVVAGYDANGDPHAWWTASNTKTSKVPGIEPDTYICNEPHTWGLGVDDGPYCVGQPLYDHFKNNSVHATLFYIGGNVASASNQAKEAFAAGHEICVHTWSHHALTTLTNSQIFAEFYYTKKIINDVLGVSTRCWRPPYGDVDDRVRTIAHALELHAVIWSQDTNDFTATAANEDQANADYATILGGDYSQSGAIILTHEVSTLAVDLFISHWTQIKQVFANVVPALACANITEIYADDDAPIYADFAGAIAGKGPTGLSPTLGAAGSFGSLQFDGQDDFAAMVAGKPSRPSSSAVPSNSASASAGASGPARSAVVAAVSASSAASAVPTKTAAAAPSTRAASLLAVLGGLIVMGAALLA